MVGPAIVEERESTLVIGPDARITVDPHGMLVVEPPKVCDGECAMNKIVDTGHQALVNQVLWARLRALMNEAGATLRRTAFSFPTRESNDFAACLMDITGDSIAQSIQSIPSFLSTLPLTTKAMLKIRPPTGGAPVTQC